MSGTSVTLWSLIREVVWLLATDQLRFTEPFTLGMSFTFATPPTLDETPREVTPEPAPSMVPPDAYVRVSYHGVTVLGSLYGDEFWFTPEVLP